MKKKYLEYALLGILLLILFAILFLYFNFEQVVDSFQEDSTPKRETKIINTYEENALLIKRLQNILDKTTKEMESLENYDMLSESSDYEDNINTLPTENKEPRFKKHEKNIDIEEEIKPKKNVIKKREFSTKNPKLAIVVDDIILQSQVDAINSLGLNINLSFLPPTNKHPNSAKIAKNQKSHLIHIPLEAFNYNNSSYNLLKENFSYKQIEKEIIRLKKLYPNAKYVNNHTGSKFTSNLQAMKRLISILDKHDFKFLDSRTSKYTKAIEASKILNIEILSRKIFLDNMSNVNYIKKQIKKAVKIAKKDGFTIAICHPKSATIRALALSKKVLKDVELVYLNDI
jgi:polysaccharide deacetylase 2 family uncharacterized protein YibQ